MSHRSKLYDNCELYTLDGQFFIGYCPKKRMEWYLEKKLATKINDNAIALNFEPKMRNGDTFEDMTERKENQCVVCGDKNGLVKFHTIPQEFKSHFPLEHKSHISNDIVLLCADHVAEANEMNRCLRNELIKAYNISDNDFIDNDKKKIIWRARHIISEIDTSGTCSAELFSRLQILIKSENILSIEDIRKISNESPKILKDGCSSIGSYIVNRYVLKNKLDDFVQLWKQNFTQTMEPNFLPKSYNRINCLEK